MKSTHRERIEILISLFPLPPFLGVARIFHWPNPNGIKRTSEPTDMMNRGQSLGERAEKDGKWMGRGAQKMSRTPTTLC